MQKHMSPFQQNLLLVFSFVMIILAVIVPIGLRMHINAKYGVVRQNCTELASYAKMWAEKSIKAQDEQKSTATLKDYFASLAGLPVPIAGKAFPGQWIAVQGGNNNWNLGAKGTVTERTTTPVFGRYINGVRDQAPLDTVEDVIPPDKTIINPFTAENVFRAANDPVTQGEGVTGAIAFGGVARSMGRGGTTPWIYFAFAFQGTQSTTINLAKDDTTFHEGMGLNSISKLRNGVFLGRYQ